VEISTFNETIQSPPIPVQRTYNLSIYQTMFVPTRPRDTLYQVESIPEDFVFSERVVEVFDDMLDRSIPFYREVIRATASLLKTSLAPADRVVDLGCATGTTLLELARMLPDKGLKLIGVDNSSAMLEKARLKTELFSKQDRITFIEEDITRALHPGTSAFLLNYTLQFIRPILREDFLKRLYADLRPGGLLILAEKTISQDARMNREFIEIYHQFKRERGYSELEIAKKREALENVLIPFSIDENKALLQRVGFSSVATFFQWFNFTAFVAVKTL
jgi:tRNA (cmo5U34)-methyltransferase